MELFENRFKKGDICDYDFFDIVIEDLYKRIYLEDYPHIFQLQNAQPKPIPVHVLSNQKIKELQNHLFSSNVEKERLRQVVEGFENRESDTMDLLRSAYQIAKRKGKKTNWDGFQNRCEVILNSKTKYKQEPAKRFNK